MVFSSLFFLYFFLPLTLIIYYITPRKIKNLILLIMSLIFYAWGEPVYIVLMIFSSVVDYMHGILIEKNRNNEIKKKLVLISSVVINLGLLSFFKYGNFAIDNFNIIFGTNIASLNLALPIGISFYTFQTMSYTIDVYRGKVCAQKNPISLAAYVTLFPQLIAGPIVRYTTIAEQLESRKENIDKFACGVRRFIIGLGKKVLLANNIGMLWNEIQKTNINELTVLTAWLGITAFGFQIYFDFSGYSDMAIGLGKMFGFDFEENFNYPFISKSITEFWRRWHMSLGSWFRDYVYISLGGNRVSRIKIYRNLFIVWFLTGLWHGASWNFVVWGLYFGVIIALEKSVFKKFIGSNKNLLKHVYTLLLLQMSWVLFVFDDIFEALRYFKIMFSINSSSLIDNKFIYYLFSNSILLIILIIASTPIIKKINSNILGRVKGCNLFVYKNIFVPIIYFIILFISTAYLSDAAYNPFLYFRF